MPVFWREWYIIRDHQLWKVLRISCSFYYLVASTACFVHIKIQVLAEREQKIQTEVKEIRKVFFCDLCNKQYKLAVEFETHLSSYDHNHRKVNGLNNLFSLTSLSQIWSEWEYPSNEACSVLKKWKKCMVQVVGMIAKNGSSSARRRKWQSLLRCNLSPLCLIVHTLFIYFFSV